MLIIASAINVSFVRNIQLPRSLLRFAASRDSPDTALIVKPHVHPRNSFFSFTGGISGTKPNKRNAMIKLMPTMIARPIACRAKIEVEGENGGRFADPNGVSAVFNGIDPIHTEIFFLPLLGLFFYLP